MPSWLAFGVLKPAWPEALCNGIVLPLATGILFPTLRNRMRLGEA